MTAHMLIARIPEHIEPMDRGDTYEDPLHEALEAAGMGEVTGGGSEFNVLPEGGVLISGVDLEIQLNDLEAGIPKVIEVLEACGAPRNSYLTILEEDDEDAEPKRIPFGKSEGVEVVVDGVNLPDEVYSDESQESFFDQIREALESAKSGSLHGSFSGSTHTSFYIYGANREAIRAAVQPVVSTHPLCQNAEIKDLPDAAPVK